MGLTHGIPAEGHAEWAAMKACSFWNKPASPNHQAITVSVPATLFRLRTQSALPPFKAIPRRAPDCFGCTSVRECFSFHG